VLLNADGSTFATVPFAPFEQRLLESPNFEPLDYRSGRNIEFGDAVHRAQFFHRMDGDWHTVLVPHVVSRTTITVPRFVNVRLSNGSIIQARTYFAGTAADGSTFVLMLDLLFKFSSFDNEVVNQIVGGTFVTKGLEHDAVSEYVPVLPERLPIRTLRADAASLGFHTFFADFSAFHSLAGLPSLQAGFQPGIFGGGFEDVTALSHETAEAFANPFIEQ